MGVGKTEVGIMGVGEMGMPHAICVFLGYII